MIEASCVEPCRPSKGLLLSLPSEMGRHTLSNVLGYGAETQVRIGKGKNRDHCWEAPAVIQVKNEVAWVSETQWRWGEVLRLWISFEERVGRIC